MIKTEERFLQELEERLAENRRLAEKSLLPKQLHGVASYWAFHNLRVLLILSWLITVVLFMWWYAPLIHLSKALFFVL